MVEPTPLRSATSSLLTFLIADVRGYTRFTVEHGDEAAGRLADRFAGLTEEIVVAYGGRVIELRGDEALVVFPSARDALRASVALQERFSLATADDPSLPFHVGIGLDAGDAVPVRGGYRGGALNLAARLCSIAGAGEVFASETVVGLARRTDGIAFRDRGEVTLKGLTAPVRVVQIAMEGALPDELPPLGPTLITHPTNLPDDPTPFIGREAAIADIADFVRRPQSRLLTLTGPGGTGKTRLATQVAAALLHDFQHGVFLVQFASITDSSLVPASIATALGLKDEGGRPLLDTLTAHLKDRQVLLVLDNLEHLPGASTSLAHLLEDCRHVQILATSRTPLHLAREREYPVLPLLVPDLDDSTDVRTISRNESVQLFVDRARAVQPAFSLFDENARAVAEICARLDGLPLAIELAAARIKLFPPSALLQRLDNRLKLLTGGARDRPTRQQTLRGAIDWSYSLLDPTESQLFARLSVFAGGFAFGAAEVVCCGDGDPDLLDGIASLIDKSLLRQGGDEEPRFTMLETIREYAGEQLEGSGERDACGRRHAGYFLDLAQEADSGLRGEMQDVWFRRLDSERNNFRTALRWSLTHDEGTMALTIAGGLRLFWWIRGEAGEGSQWLDRALAMTPHDKSLARALALSGAGLLASVRNDFQHAGELLDNALRLFRELGNRSGEAEVLLNLGALAWFMGDLEAGTATTKTSLDVAQEAGDAWCIAHATGNLGFTYILRGDMKEGLALSERSVTLHRRRGDRQGLLHALDNVGHAALHLQNVQRAAAAWREGLNLLVGASNNWTTPWNLAGLAASCAVTCQPERAARLFGAAEAAREAMGIPLPPGEEGLHDEYIRSARAQVDETTWQRAWQEGRAMRMETAIAYALDGESPPGP